MIIDLTFTTVYNERGRGEPVRWKEGFMLQFPEASALEPEEGKSLVADLPEKNPPVRNAKGTQGFCTFRP